MEGKSCIITKTVIRPKGVGGRRCMKRVNNVKEKDKGEKCVCPSLITSLDNRCEREKEKEIEIVRWKEL